MPKPKKKVRRASRGGGSVHTRCRNYWGAAATRLARLLDAETRNAVRSAHRQGTRPGGWIPGLKARADYAALVTLYDELLLALKQPSHVPDHWRPDPASTVRSGAIGAAARAVLKGLAADGAAVDRATGKAWHSNPKFNEPWYGRLNWLEKGMEQHPPVDYASLRIARILLSSLRRAMGR